MSCSDAAKGEEGAKLGGEIRAKHTVASIFVGRHGARFEEMIQTIVSGSFATDEWMGSFGVSGVGKRIWDIWNGCKRSVE